MNAVTWDMSNIAPVSLNSGPITAFQQYSGRISFWKSIEMIRISDVGAQTFQHEKDGTSKTVIISDQNNIHPSLVRAECQVFHQRGKDSY